MVEVSGKPMLWHILKTYSHHGINEFIICCGYRGYMIKEYFANYFLHSSDVTFHMESNHMEIHKQNAEPWKVTLVDTGEATLTGGRLARVSDYLNDTFCFTYGDGVADVDIQALVQPPGRYGAIGLDGYQVQQFQEKPDGDGGWINGGYFVLEPSVLDVRRPAALAGRLHLQIDKANHQLGWQPRWPFATTVQRTVDWYQAVHEGVSPMDCCMSDLELYGATLATLRSSTDGASGAF